MGRQLGHWGTGALGLSKPARQPAARWVEATTARRLSVCDNPSLLWPHRNLPPHLRPIRCLLCLASRRSAHLEHQQKRNPAIMRPTLVNNLRVLVPVKRTIDYVRVGAAQVVVVAAVLRAGHRHSRDQESRGSLERRC